MYIMGQKELNFSIFNAVYQMFINIDTRQAGVKHAIKTQPPNGAQKKQ